MSTNSDRIISLKDGRRLSYIEYGDPAGKPFVYFHGLPSSRFDAHWTDEAARRLGARIISVDRPGMGFSDFKPGRTLLDWPDDVLELAETLHLNRFGVIGVSGGGPYAAVCAYRIPQLTAAGIVVGLGPVDRPGALEGRLNSELALISALRRVPWFARVTVFNYLAIIAKLQPSVLTNIVLGNGCAEDLAWLAQADHHSTYTHVLKEVFRQGGRGYYWDSIILYTQPWGFHLEEIGAPVYLWHGLPDKNAPVADGRYVASKIPNCQAKFYEHEGHLTIPNCHSDEIISALVMNQ